MADMAPDPRTPAFQAALDQAVADGRVFSKRHDELGLTLYCYTRGTQLELDWDPITETARGLVIADDGTVAAWPLRKFHQHKDLASLPAGTPRVVEKVDGSMLVAFRHHGRLVTNTKGGFTSDQAIAGRALLEQAYDTTAIEEHHTYVFEFIHPANRIVVSYGDVIEVVLLMVRDNRTGTELDHDQLEGVADRLGCRTAERYELEEHAPAELAELDWDDAEGFVLVYPDAARVKVKFATYVQLHGLRTSTPTARAIWDALRRGMPLADVVANSPDEYDQWVRDMAQDMVDRVEELAELVRHVHDRLDLASQPTRKQVAGAVFGPWPEDLDLGDFDRREVQALLMPLHDGMALDPGERDPLGLPFGPAKVLWNAVKPAADVEPPDADLLVGITVPADDEAA